MPIIPDGQTDKINIFFICDESYSLFSREYSISRFGGAGLRMFFMAEEMARDSDYRVVFVFMKFDVSHLSHPTIELKNPVPEIKRGLPLIARSINRKRVAKLYGPGDKNVVISTMGHLAPQLIQQAEKAKGPSVFIVASDADVTNPIGCDPENQEKIISAIAQCDAVITQNNFQHDALLKAKNKESTIIGNGIPFVPESSQGRDCVLWVSSAQCLKQPWYFFDLAQEFPQEKFVMIIPLASPEVSEQAARRAKALSNLEVIDHQIPYDEVNQYFARAKLFVNTSEFEGFPNTFLQAAATGIPIVSLGVNPDGFLEKKQIGESAGWNYRRFLEIVETYLNDDDLRRKHGANGLLFIEKEKNMTRVVEDYKRVITQALADYR